MRKQVELLKDHSNACSHPIELHTILHQALSLKKDLSFIFDRFRMGDDTHNRQYEGMGVGLFICKKLVELLGGEIEVRSEKKSGSYFSFYLPLQKNKQIF